MYTHTHTRGVLGSRKKQDRNSWPDDLPPATIFFLSLAGRTNTSITLCSGSMIAAAHFVFIFAFIRFAEIFQNVHLLICPCFERHLYIANIKSYIKHIYVNYKLMFLIIKILLATIYL